VKGRWKRQEKGVVLEGTGRGRKGGGWGEADPGNSLHQDTHENTSWSAFDISQDTAFRAMCYTQNAYTRLPRDHSKDICRCMPVVMQGSCKDHARIMQRYCTARSLQQQGEQQQLQHVSLGLVICKLPGWPARETPKQVQVHSQASYQSAWIPHSAMNISTGTARWMRILCKALLTGPDSRQSVDRLPLVTLAKAKPAASNTQWMVLGVGTFRFPSRLVYCSHELRPYKYMRNLLKAFSIEKLSEMSSKREAF